MDRRTFVKFAASTPLLAKVALAEAGQKERAFKEWPEVVSFDNPIGGLVPLHFIEEIPLTVQAECSCPLLKAMELFRYTAHEWIGDAVLFRGIEIRPKNHCDYCTLPDRKLLDTNIGVYVDDYKAVDAGEIGTYVKEGGAPFPLHNPRNSRTVLYATYRGWVDKDGFPDPDRFLGYFLPNETSLSIIVPGFQTHSISVEIKCDMARYGFSREQMTRYGITRKNRNMLG